MERKEKDKEWWHSQDMIMQNRMSDLRWQRYDSKHVTKYAKSFSLEYAFIFGTGPSISCVEHTEWAALSRFFTIGVNDFLPIAKRELPGVNVPALYFISDPRVMDDLRMNSWVAAMRDYEGKTLVSYTACRFPHDWEAPVFGVPSKDIEFGLAITPSAKTKFNRSVVPMIHLCALIGFKNICLLGVDHGKDYYANDTEDACNAFLDFQKDFLAPRKIKLWNSGEKSAITTINRLPLRKALKNGTSNLCAATG